MAHWQREALERARTYASLAGIQLRSTLGSGFDGIVLATSRRTAVKALGYEPLYQRERDVYLRLQASDVSAVEGFAIPAMLAFDDVLRVVEMDIVTPPYVLDFAGAYLDERPDYPPEVIANWQQEKREQFGDERWGIVQSIMATFARHGVYLADIKPGNITFAE